MKMRSVPQVMRAVRSLLADDGGQDLVEYALLAGLVSVAGAMLFPTIRDHMATAYQSWIDRARDISAPPPPM